MQNRPLRGEAALAVTPGLRFHGAWLFIEVTDAEREQIKLRAAAIDRVLTACTTIGVLAPLAGTFLSGSAAVMAADGYAWATGGLGVCVLSHGPGFNNGLTAATTASKMARSKAGRAAK